MRNEIIMIGTHMCAFGLASYCFGKIKNKLSKEKLKNLTNTLN